VVGSPSSLAVHPTQNRIVALGTRSGVYLSHDSGETFQRFAEAAQVLALCFAFDGQHLWFSSMDGTPALTRLHWQTGQVVPIELPALHQDAVIYLAHNPVHAEQWAMATHKRDVYVSADAGKTWQQIARQGEAR
jgi:hypothetical protein